ncbi:MAG: GGDEF domain-containing protein [Methylotenera sp.]
MLIITGVSVLISMAIAAVVGSLLPTFSMKPSLLTSAIIPLVIAPLVSLPFVKMLFQLNFLEMEMRELATYDALTKLLNRRAFLERAEFAYNVAKREKQNFCILAVDLDLFKLINDQYGHATGDEVLALFGQITQQTSRESDIFGRVGGEEFSFFLPNTTIDEAENFVNRLHTAIRQASVNYKGMPIHFTVSIGLVAFTGMNISKFDSLLQFADAALYEAKKQGRNRTVKAIGL